MTDEHYQRILRETLVDPDVHQLELEIASLRCRLVNSIRMNRMQTRQVKALHAAIDQQSRMLTYADEVIAHVRGLTRR